MLVSQIQKEERELEKAKERVDNTLKAQSFLQEIAQEIQSNTHKKVAKIATKCLSSVFSDPYELIIELDKKRGKTEAEFVYYKNNNKVNPRQTSGGVLDIAALALRIVSLSLETPPPMKFLSLDEPCLGVSGQNRERVRALLLSLSEELGIQLLVITHSPELEVGKVIKL
jgi:DNA repair exonuclease SbcCD ATPase subunit